PFHHRFIFDGYFLRDYTFIVSNLTPMSEACHKKEFDGSNSQLRPNTLIISYGQASAAVSKTEYSGHLMLLTSG
ncbi:MAG: hypothetical protein KDC85_18660, partial [Saprospiraceae bacterium]|nr:hypothetical protein [Saprospiraceae bacterium]